MKHSPTIAMNKTKVVGFSFALCLMLFAVLAFPQGHFVVVVTNPNGPQDRIMQVIAGAGGLFVEAGRRPWIAVAYSDSDNFARRLMQSGALIVLNHSLAARCFQRER